jgi:hypothetical protein
VPPFRKLIALRIDAGDGNTIAKSEGAKTCW